MFSLNNTSPVSIDIIKKVPPVAGTIILSFAIIGLAVVYTELFSLPKITFHKVSPFLLSIAKKFPSKSLANTKFLKDVILPHFNEDLLYQKIPTFRIQIPNNISVAEFHNDKSYSHSPHEVNIFLPITEAKETYTIWSESQENLGDYSPMNAEYGEYYIWDGANLKHGNKINESDISRFSVDFRVLPYSKYDENNMQETITTKIKLKLGSYFDLMEVNT